MKYTTKGWREINDATSEESERMHGPPDGIENYTDDIGQNEIDCSTDEREAFERDFGASICDSDQLNAQTFCLFRDWLKENAELKSDEELDAERQNEKHELEARRADAKQLERMVNLINAAMPDFKSMMGSECDHAELALKALIAERDTLKGGVK